MQNRYRLGLTMLALVALATSSVVAQESKKHKKQVFDRGIEQTVFVPKGQYFTGVNFAYTVVESDNFKMLMLNGLDGGGYTLNVSPYMGYTFTDNLGAGLRFKYRRSEIDIKNASLKINIGDDEMSIGFKDAYLIQHTYYGTGFFRSYINFGDSKRFGLYSEVQLTFGGGQSKIAMGTGLTKIGTFQETREFEVGMAPGMVAFINNFAAVDLSVGMLGFNITKTEQVTNQVYKGSIKNTSANFRINIFSVSLGVSIYIPTLNPF